MGTKHRPPLGQRKQSGGSALRLGPCNSFIFRGGAVAEHLSVPAALPKGGRAYLSISEYLRKAGAYKVR
jgi:hypothetical protein